ncbi:biliverdin-producing heme oxygenase [Acidisarcina polymorpha]|uniref:biliverdin-producing heme oxygenase n=1 Tax=Acidisarcina polymorpha TaxID=2211140 RepID=UPI0013752FE2|nr:biliverdin-producing heme oxygenase [Acidisarcina polymorpha]
METAAESPDHQQQTVQSASSALSLRLRNETSSLHEQVERDLRLPDSIHTLDEYRECLIRFYRLYRPLEAALLGCDGWSDAGLSIQERLRTVRLASDLCALGVVPIMMRDAPVRALPVMPSFAHSLGALYVLEGATLGARFILRRLEQVLGAQLTGATAFFACRIPNAEDSWKYFKKCLDDYGIAHPGEAQQVIEGAIATFRSIGEWMKNDQHR